MVALPMLWLALALWVVTVWPMGVYFGNVVYEDASRRGNPRADAWGSLVAIAIVFGLVLGVALYLGYVATRDPAIPHATKPA